MQLNKITAVILAAGLSRRMGESKQLLAWGESTVLGTTISNVLAASQVDDVLVITGGYKEPTEAVAHAANVETVHNAAFAEGEMLSSLQVAVGELAQEVAGMLVVLGDMPLVKPKTIDAISNAFVASEAEIVVPTFEGKRGHPVLFGRNLFPKILAIPQGQSPNYILRNNRDKVLFLPVASNTIHIDIDDPETYKRYRPRR